MRTDLDEGLDKVIAEGETFALLADHAATIARTLGLSREAQDARSLAQRCRDRNFQIIFVGEFSSGKSTVINSLLGSPVMPTDILETNAILTKIKHGERSALLYRDDDPSPVRVEAEELRKHITVDHDDRGAKNPWNHAELFYPLDLLERGVIIVDPPGTNKMDERAQITIGETAKSDAAVYLCMATQPLKASERFFIENFLRSKECFWIMTRADSLVGDAQRTRVRGAMEYELGEVRPDDGSIPSRIFFVNAQQAEKASQAQDDEAFAASGMAPFLAALREFITGDRHRAKMRQLCVKLDEILASLAQFSEAQVIDTERARDEIVRRGQKLRTEIEDASQDAEGAVRRLKMALPAVADKVERQVRIKIRALPKQPPKLEFEAIRTVPIFTFNNEAYDGNKDQVVKEVQVMVQRSVEGELSRWFDRDLIPLVMKDVEAELDLFNRERARFTVRLADIRDEYLGRDLVSGGHEASVPPLQLNDMRDTLRPAIAAIKDRAKATPRNIIWNSARALFRPEGARASDVTGIAVHDYYKRMSEAVLKGIAEQEEQMGTFARELTSRWLDLVLDTARKAIKDPRHSLQDTAKEGELASKLGREEKARHREMLASAQSELRKLASDLAAAHAFYNPPDSNGS